MVLVDHRSTHGLGVVHDDVQKGVVDELLPVVGVSLLLLLPGEEGVVLQEGLLEALKVLGQNRRPLAERAEVGKNFLQERLEGVLSEPLALLFEEKVLLVQDLEGLPENPVDQGLLLHELLLLLFRELLVLLLLHLLPPLQGNGEKALLRGLKQETQLLNLPVDLQEELVLPASSLLLQGAGLGSVGVLLQNPGKGPFHQLQDLLHSPVELSAHAGRKLEGPRVVGIVEIVDEGDVPRPLFLEGQPLQVTLDRRGPPGSGVPHHEDVEPFALDPKAELQGLESRLLPDDPLQRLELRGVLEGEVLLWNLGLKLLRLYLNHS
ncbi:MAG: hypothetical protein BWY86_00863 [Candidatus Aminicenantes bacterium ADurb.Bin508]|nr:MAG: hypothetical protein BWY86_00863 [Candidatus Aminicenantes bacterium ADurb.Bin508]